MTSFLTTERDGHVVTLTLNRPEKRNAISTAEECAEVADTCRALNRDDSVRVVIVTGAGDRAFCAGYDLRDNLETGVMEIPPTGFAGFNARTDYPLPVIAAVNGVALGGGFELALACDFIVASSNAAFALPEPKVGWAALGGGLQRLPRSVGMKRAMDIILTGRTVDAEEARAIGLVSEVTEPANLRATARRWAAP